MPLPPMIQLLPPSAVTVVFRGLLTFCFNGGTSCEVGVLNEFFTGQEHDFLFRKWIKSPQCPREPKIFNKPVNTFELRVNKPLPGFDGVFFFGQNPFVRTGASNHRNDFRWMIDFESDLYSAPVPKKTGKITPRLGINKGVFYTHQKTLSKFNGVPSSGSGQIKLGGGSVAEVMAANIYLAAGGFVEIIIDGVPVDTLSPTTGTSFQVDVFNLCDPSPHPACDFLPAHPTDKRKRNDFYMYYNAVDLSGGLEEYQLMAVLPPAQATPITGICTRPGEHSTDPAPCGPAGFGQTFPFP